MNEPQYATEAVHRIAGALLVAGEQPSDVANTLAHLDCKGNRESATTNPVAAYLTQQGIRDPEVTWTSVGYVARTAAFGHDLNVPLPDPVAMFMAQFDAGQWPDLDINS